jgi:hypothetical protein
MIQKKWKKQIMFQPKRYVYEIPMDFSKKKKKKKIRGSVLVIMQLVEI